MHNHLILVDFAISNERNQNFDEITISLSILEKLMFEKVDENSTEARVKIVFLTEIPR